MIERYSRPQMKRVWSDENKFAKWLEVEIAACEAWAEVGVIPREAIPKIKLARVNLKRMEEILKETHHDVTAFLGSVAESLGNESRFIHLGLTSSDVIDTALSLQLIEATELLDQDIKELISVLAEKAIKYKYTPMMGRTHGIHAEPTSFGLKLALWIEEMKRNRLRLAEAKRAIAAGKISGAVGTYATLSPQLEEKVCAKLKLAPAPVSSQILQRDRHAQFTTTLAIISSSLEKFATEIRGLQKTETREVEEPFGASQTGSSAMPHKRNPIMCERIAGLSRILRANALAGMENVTLWHERDISHSSVERVIIPDSCIVADYMIANTSRVIERLLVYPENMKRNLNLTKGLVFSESVLLALTKKGMKREEAYQIVQKHAMDAWKTKQDFQGLLRCDERIKRHLTEQEVKSLFDLNGSLKNVDAIFQRVGLS